MPEKEISQKQLQELAQTTANLVINLWLPRYRAWQREQIEKQRRKRHRSQVSDHC